MYFIFHLPEIREVGKGSVDWPIGITNSETLIPSNFTKPLRKATRGLGGLFYLYRYLVIMIRILLFALLLSTGVYGQRLSKSDKKTLSNLKTHIEYLASDALEGRRTGTEGERKAYEYIIAAFQKNKIGGGAENGSYLQPFDVNDGRFVAPGTHFEVNGKTLQQGTDYFPLAFSANGKAACDVYLSLKEAGEIWGLDLADEIAHQSQNPHWDPLDYILDQVKKYSLLGATGVVVYNSSATKDDLVFNSKSRIPTVKIPVIYLTREAKNKYLFDETGKTSLSLQVDIIEKHRTGHNVIARIDNGAAQTIILGAHYDHLGRGQDHNSRYLDDTLTIHNGADDNASGVAGLIELSRMLKAVKTKEYNFEFIAFSGEELGLYGSKAFTENPYLDLQHVDYMINMDMIGRFNDSTRILTVGGYGTSPSWATLLNRNNGEFNIHIDSSGTGPSDHTSFYLKNIPVLFFFTGTHPDYHRPEDDADKINYKAELKIVNFIFGLVKSTLSEPKLAFLKTRETSTGGAKNFKVTLGIMPDYTFAGVGIHVDGVSPGKPAEKAGIKTGDVLIQLGDYPFQEIESYMTALSKFQKGDSTKLTFIRNGETKQVMVTF